MNSSIAFPLLLTLLAGLATGIGSAIAFFAHRTNVRFLSFSLGLSAGVMIYVSFVELFAESQTLLTAQWGATAGVSATVACFFGGILLIGVIDRLVPSFENPHEMHSVEEMNRRPHDRKLMRMGLMTALVIGIHNFPEGIATFMSAIDNPTLGIAIAAAIAIHNIPEGIAVSVPIYYATGSRRKAFLLSLSSGLAEPIGALLAYAVLLPFLSPTLLGCLFGFVAGIMVFISLDELLPAAEDAGSTGCTGVALECWKKKQTSTSTASPPPSTMRQVDRGLLAGAAGAAEGSAGACSSRILWATSSGVPSSAMARASFSGPAASR
jgi:ZIP family zinc transporter